MELFDSNGIGLVPKQNHTSKGDQPKWLFNNIWYKADYMGYESLSEVIVTNLLNNSNVKEFVFYKPCEIIFEDKHLKGCSSVNFKTNNESLITLEKLHRSYFGIGLADELSHIRIAKEKIKYTVDFVVDKTGLNKFGTYLTTMLALDALTLNEDRHTNNIAVIRNETTKQYRLCPYFDNGLSLLSDLNDYPIETSIYNLIDKVRAKPFDSSFDEQLDAAESLYDCNLQIRFSQIDIEKMFDSFNGWYDSQLLYRVKKVLLEQKRKYSIFFK